jgi:RNA polymerase sigma-70 factor (ECF subfamily)
MSEARSTNPDFVSTGVWGRSDAHPTRLEAEVTALFEEWRAPVMRYLLNLGLRPQDGEEIVQEVFLALFRHLRAGKPRDNIRGWVFRVAHNLGLKRRYSKGGLHDSEPTEQRSDPAPNPEEAFAAAQRQRKLLAVVNALPEQDRSCLHLRAEGLRYREISEVLGMSLGAVALSLSRSLAKLTRADK